MKLIKSFLIIVCLVFTSCFAEDTSGSDYVYLYDDADAIKYKTNFLPDGTEVKFEGKKIFYVCKSKLKPMPDGIYMLADGTVIKVKQGKIKSDLHKYQRPNEEKRQRLETQAPAADPKEKLVPHSKPSQDTTNQQATNQKSS